MKKVSQTKPSVVTETESLTEPIVVMKLASQTKPTVVSETESVTEPTVVTTPMMPETVSETEPTLVTDSEPTVVNVLQTETVVTVPKILSETEPTVVTQIVSEKLTMVTEIMSETEPFVPMDKLSKKESTTVTATSTVELMPKTEPTFVTEIVPETEPTTFVTEIVPETELTEPTVSKSESTTIAQTSTVELMPKTEPTFVTEIMPETEFTPTVELMLKTEPTFVTEIMPETEFIEPRVLPQVVSVIKKSDRAKGKVIRALLINKNDNTSKPHHEEKIGSNPVSVYDLAVASQPVFDQVSNVAATSQHKMDIAGYRFY
jgi:hypothetical protein